MKIENKTIMVILATTIMLSTFVGLVMAAPNVKKAPAVILGSFSGNEIVSDFVGVSDDLEASRITTNKPAIFTVTVTVTNTNLGDSVYLTQSVNQDNWVGSWGSQIKFPEDNSKTFTVAGYGVVLTYRHTSFSPINISYCIIVEGVDGTVVTVG